MYLRSASEAGSGRSQVITRTDRELPHACAREPPELVTCTRHAPPPLTRRFGHARRHPGKPCFPSSLRVRDYQSRRRLLRSAVPRYQTRIRAPSFCVNYGKAGRAPAALGRRCSKGSGAANPAPATHHESPDARAGFRPFPPHPTLRAAHWQSSPPGFLQHRCEWPRLWHPDRTGSIEARADAEDDGGSGVVHGICSERIAQMEEAVRHAGL